MIRVWSRTRVELEQREKGFTLAELMVVMSIIGIMVGIASWMLASSRDVHTAKTGQVQLVTDLRLCSTRAQGEKKTYGLKIRSSSASANPNTYTFVRVEPAGTITEIDPILGASSKNRNVPMPGGGHIVALLPGAYSTNGVLTVLFAPVGSLTFAKYSSGGTPTLTTQDVIIRVGDGHGGSTRDVTVNTLGTVSP